jgi:ABC-type uncharacterized transport system fused permease/ATPase subunit
MTISRSETIATEAETPCVKMVPSRLAESRVDLLVNILVSMVNLITFTEALLWKKSSISFRLLVNYSYSIRSQLWKVQRKRAWSNIYVIKHRRGDKDV